MKRDRLSASDHLDKVALVAAFLGGAVGAWTIKFLGLGPFWAAGWTVGSMLLYVAAVTALGRLRIEPEAIGDNCYYLGFLLTLASLAATLYQLSQGDDQVELMRSIISGFGIALVSTILGILLRVIFIQLRPDIVARDREARVELQQAARELRLELASSVAAIKDFSTEAIQVASEQGARISEMTNASVEAQRGRMQSDAEVYSQTLREALADAGAQSAKAIAGSVETAAQAVQASSAASLEALGRAVSDFGATQQAALAATGATFANVSALASRVEEVSKRLSSALDGIASDIARGVGAIEATRQRLEQHERDAELSAAAAAASAAAAAEAAIKSDEAARPRASGLFGWSR